jgi:hypothetical protein
MIFVAKMFVISLLCDCIKMHNGKIFFGKDDERQKNYIKLCIFGCCVFFFTGSIRELKTKEKPHDKALKE